MLLRGASEEGCRTKKLLGFITLTVQRAQKSGILGSCHVSQGPVSWLDYRSLFPFVMQRVGSSQPLGSGLGSWFLELSLQLILQLFHQATCAEWILQQCEYGKIPTKCLLWAGRLEVLWTFKEESLKYLDLQAIKLSSHLKDSWSGIQLPSFSLLGGSVQWLSFSWISRSGENSEDEALGSFLPILLYFVKLLNATACSELLQSIEEM